MNATEKKHKETCQKCGNVWWSRAQAIENVTCPKCQFRPAYQRLSHPKDNGYGTYNKAEVNRFIKYLGLWTFSDYREAVNRRDINDYKESLEKLIKVNATRHDQAGMWETEAAQKTLNALHGKS